MKTSGNSKWQIARILGVLGLTYWAVGFSFYWQNSLLSEASRNLFILIGCVGSFAVLFAAILLLILRCRGYGTLGLKMYMFFCILAVLLSAGSTIPLNAERHKVAIRLWKSQNVCINNLRMIDNAKQAWAEANKKHGNEGCPFPQ